jgi:hypothetical protein
MRSPGLDSPAGAGGSLADRDGVRAPALNRRSVARACRLSGRRFVPDTTLPGCRAIWPRRSRSTTAPGPSNRCGATSSCSAPPASLATPGRCAVCSPAATWPRALVAVVDPDGDGDRFCLDGARVIHVSSTGRPPGDRAQPPDLARRQGHRPRDRSRLPRRVRRRDHHHGGRPPPAQVRDAGAGQRPDGVVSICQRSRAVKARCAATATV